MKNLNKIIIILIIFIIIILGFLIFLLKEQDNNIAIENELNAPEVNIEEVFNTENKVQPIETKSEYFNIKNCIKIYSKYSTEALNNNSATKLLNIMPDFVKQELGLENSNVYEKVGLVNKIIRIDNIYKSLQTISTQAYEESTNICAYIIKGVLIDKNTYAKENLKMVIILDINNSTFLVIPQKYIEQKQINLEANNNFVIYNREVIDSNEYNTFSYSSATAEDMSKEYFNIFKTSLIYDLEYVYNCLDTEYREKRFGSYEKFKTYIKNNQQQLKSIEFNKYVVNYDEKYIEYVCNDQYENLYIFKEKTPMNFTLKLDTYTITTSKYLSEYNKAKEQQKVMMNIDKWIQMLNNRDYTSAYKLLDETFRNNNFGSEEEFEEYMRNKYPLCYEIEFSDFSSQANLYIQKIKLTDITNKKQTQEELTIIMQLKEDLDFIMSFNIK